MKNVLGLAIISCFFLTSFHTAAAQNTGFIYGTITSWDGKTLYRANALGKGRSILDGYVQCEQDGK